MSVLAIDLIQYCIDIKGISLDIGNCGLTNKDIAEGTEFDKLLRQCTHLQTLILSNEWYERDISGKPIKKFGRYTGQRNYFNILPPALETLVELKTLVCGGTRLAHRDISNMQIVANLVGLQSLNLSYNNIAEIKGLENLNNLKSLDLSYNNISEIKGLENLANLNFLDFSDNQITEIKGLENLNNLNSLDFNRNQITEIQGLENLVNLNSLDFNSNQIAKIKGVENLINLNSLDFMNNQVTQIKSLENLTSLNSLNFRDNKITEIKGLENLTNLNSLNFRNNKITEIKGLENLTSLTSLDLRNNRITEIKGLENLTSLNLLDISDNRITEIKGLENLTSLTSLDISENQITEIKGLENLTSLNSVDIRNNQITRIKGLENLTSLNLLDISDNRIIEINGLENLTSLTSLDFSRNQISEIKSVVPFIKREINPLYIILKQSWETAGAREINVRANPIVTPPMAIVKQGNEAILRFFNEELEARYEAKLLIVGEPEAGKTSLMKKITDSDYIIPATEDSTIGIQVIKWICTDSYLPKPVQINIWDFGGQEMQYLTHQFFLSADALYLLLTSARKDFDNLDYWFNIISLLGKNESNQNSELLVVANEIKMPEGQVSKSFDVKKYSELYPHLPFSFQCVNLATAFDKDGRFATIQHLVKEKLSLLPIMGKQLPVKWGLARKKLADLKVNYLTIEKYLSVCTDADIDEKLALDLSNYLHTIGEAVHFKTDDYVILNPKWAVDGMYTILKRKDIETNDGHFTQEEVYGIWNEAGYTYPECNLLLSLMTKDSFEVAYKIPGIRNEYIAPQLLSLIQPDYDWDKAGALHFRYFYPFMPKGIITRLIVRLHKSIKYQNGKGLVWRTGAVLEKNGCIAKVEEIKIPTTGQQVIAIEVSGNRANRKLLLYDICSTIEGIHKDSFSKIIFERHIPCHCEHCINQDQPGFYDYSELVEYLNEGIEKIRCKLKVKNELIVRLLLQDIFDVDFTKLDYISHLDIKKEIVNELLFNDPFGINKTEKRKKKIFISYSQKDTRFKFSNAVEVNFIEDLKTHLKSLKRLGLADTWSDTDLLAGADWNAEIKEQLAGADIILFLVSANLIATDYVWDEEMPLAKFHKDNKNRVIIPVILNHCQWQSIQLFSEHNAVPHKGKPIASYNNVEEAYNEITAKIKALIES